MISNREVSRLFSLYAELLLLHRQDERLAVLLSGAAYRVRKMENEITEPVEFCLREFPDFIYKCLMVCRIKAAGVNKIY